MIDLYHNLPHLDLHGYDRDYARIAINDFISDNIKMKNQKIVIIHGRGSGILKKTTHYCVVGTKYTLAFTIHQG